MQNGQFRRQHFPPEVFRHGGENPAGADVRAMKINGVPDFVGKGCRWAIGLIPPRQ
jgi:hypothetical protein